MILTNIYFDAQNFVFYIFKPWYFLNAQFILFIFHWTYLKLSNFDTKKRMKKKKMCLVFVWKLFWKREELYLIWYTNQW